MNWKVVAGFAVVGALISLVAGLVGGNPFGVVLLRLFLSALVSSALGTGALLLLRSFLPELFGRKVAPAEQESPAVNIVIDEELPLEGGSLLGEPAAGGAGGVLARDAGRAETLSEGLQTDFGSEDGLPESLDSAEPSEEPAELEGAPGEIGDGLDLLEGEAEVEAAASSSGDAAWEPLAEETGDLDALPELEPTPPTPREAARSKIDQSMAGQDPAELAKAVRTFLRKDQEG